MTVTRSAALRDWYDDDIELTSTEEFRVRQGRKNFMQWRGPRGESVWYEGPMFDLGYGIKGRHQDRGIRGLVWDLAFGYVSGFPVSHILHYALTHVFRPKAVERGRLKFHREVEAGTHIKREWKPKRGSGRNIP